MSRASLYAIILIVALLVTGAAFLVAWDIPAPSGGLEIVVPNDRFPN
jgi:hypothetical protein